jgi:hypothetical protein
VWQESKTLLLELSGKNFRQVVNSRNNIHAFEGCPAHFLSHTLFQPTSAEMSSTLSGLPLSVLTIAHDFYLFLFTEHSHECQSSTTTRKACQARHATPAHAMSARLRARGRNYRESDPGSAGMGGAVEVEVCSF